MDPKQFTWTEDQQVTVTNPTDEPFKFKVHAKDYQVGAGKTARMPGYIAWVYVYNMSSKLAQDEGEFNRWNEEGFREQYFDRIVVGIDALVQDIEEEESSDVEEFPEAPLPAGGSNYTPKAKQKTA